MFAILQCQLPAASWPVKWPRTAEACIGAAVPGKYPTCSGVVQLSVCSQKSDASQVLSNFKAKSTRIVRIPLTPGQIHYNVNDIKIFMTVRRLLWLLMISFGLQIYFYMPCRYFIVFQQYYLTYFVVVIYILQLFIRRIMTD